MIGTYQCELHWTGRVQLQKWTEVYSLRLANQTSQVWHMRWHEIHISVFINKVLLEPRNHTQVYTWVVAAFLLPLLGSCSSDHMASKAKNIYYHFIDKVAAAYRAESDTVSGFDTLGMRTKLASLVSASIIPVLKKSVISSMISSWIISENVNHRDPVLSMLPIQNLCF